MVPPFRSGADFRGNSFFRFKPSGSLIEERTEKAFGCLLIGIMQASNCIETRAQSRSVMLLKCSGPHAHYTDSANELLLISDLAACFEESGESFEPES